MLCIAQSMVVSLGRSSPGAGDAVGQCEKGIWEWGKGSRGERKGGWC